MRSEKESLESIILMTFLGVIALGISFAVLNVLEGLEMIFFLAGVILIIIIGVMTYGRRR